MTQAAPPSGGYRRPRKLPEWRTKDSTRSEQLWVLVPQAGRALECFGRRDVLSCDRRAWTAHLLRR